VLQVQTQSKIQKRRSIVDSFRKSARLPKYKRIHDFFEEGFELTDDDRYKTFELRFSPWIRTLCDWYHDHETPWIYLIYGSQLSKTTFMMGVQLFVSQHERGAVPCHWCLSGEEEARQFVSNRLRNFLDESSREEARDAIKRKNWTNSYFKVYNSSVKVGWGSSKLAMRGKPGRYLFGDECGIWKETTEYLKKRARTFSGKEKGFFATTPPEDPEHHSMKSARAGNWYQWHVPCPTCGVFQYMKFSNLRFSEAKKSGVWDYEELQKCTRYCCEACGAEWAEGKKVEIMNHGKAVCVDPKTYEPCEERKTDTKTLQIPATYSVFTPFSRLSTEFIKAKAAGYEAMRVFWTDELAESPEAFGESVKQSELEKFVDYSRKSGMVAGYDLYTAGIDVQRKGELFYTVVGWRRAALVSGHVLKYGIVSWKDAQGNNNWQQILQALSDYMSVLYCAPIDSSDGEVTQQVYDFCNWAGRPFVPLKDYASTAQKVQFKMLEIDPRTKRKIARRGGQMLMVVNSIMLKDEIAAAFRRVPGDVGAWTFPGDTEDRFFKHLANEHRIEERRGGYRKFVWKPKYQGAPQHWFSSLVYATAGMEDQRFMLQSKARSPIEKKQAVQRIKPVDLYGQLNPYNDLADPYS